MKNCAERIAISVFALTLSAVGANAQLNPTVKVMSAPVTPVPAECVEGAAPQAQPRIEVAQLPEASKRKATATPPGASLRGLLQDVQNAADRSDRAAFRDALARTKGMLTTYPTGGERTAATEVIAIDDDLDRIWTYQLETATGAFFDASTVPAEITRKYPGYERAIADQVLIDARGHRFYPTVETREFLLRETAQRLSRLGVSVPLRAARVPRILPRTSTQQAAARPAASVKHVTAAEKQAAEMKSAEPKRPHAKPRRRAKAHVVAETTEHKKTAARTEIAGAEAKKPVAVAQAEPPKAVAPRSKSKVAEPVEAAKAAEPSTSTHETKPAEGSKTAALPASSSTAPSPMAPAAGASLPGTATSFPPAGTPTATDTTASAPGSAMATTSPTETTASAASTDTTATAAQVQKQGKSLILPIILIVVGIGVLIVLFRASS